MSCNIFMSVINPETHSFLMPWDRGQGPVPPFQGTFNTLSHLGFEKKGPGVEGGKKDRCTRKMKDDTMDFQ